MTCPVISALNSNHYYQGQDRDQSNECQPPSEVPPLDYRIIINIILSAQGQDGARSF